jgi:hypothetical protein
MVRAINARPQARVARDPRLRHSRQHHTVCVSATESRQESYNAVSSCLSDKSRNLFWKAQAHCTQPGRNLPVSASSCHVLGNDQCLVLLFSIWSR